MKLFHLTAAVLVGCAWTASTTTACGVAGESDAATRRPRPEKNATKTPSTPAPSPATPTPLPPATTTTKPTATTTKPSATTTKPSATTATPSTTTAAPAPSTPATGGSWWKPTPGTSYQIQLDGVLDLSPKVQMFDLDLFDTDTATIAKLQAQGVKVVCYFSAGTYENWRTDKAQFTKEMYSAALPEWEGEWWLDTRHAKVREIMKTRMALAKEKGCDAVDPDNVDAAFNDSGLPLTAEDQLDYNTFLADTAHALGLAIGLKNDLNQVKQLASVFDFAVNEQCYQYKECEMLVPFIKLNKAVFGIEYQGAKEPACKQANELQFDTLFKSFALKSERYSCREESA